MSIPVQELQQRTTSSEFVEWMQYLEEEQNEPTVEHHYLAQIAAVIAQAHSKKGKKVKLSDFIIRFTDTKPKRSDCESSKAFWFGLVGLTGRSGK